MATKRIGKGDKLNGATSVQEMVGPGSKVDSESKKRKVRQESKIQAMTEDKQSSDKRRWLIIIIVLILSAIGLLYYISYYNNGVSAPLPVRSKSTQVPKTTPKTKTDTKRDIQEQVRSKKNAENRSSKEKMNTEQVNTLGKPPKATKKTRILRRAYPPSDPDKPYLVEIINADNLLEAGDYTRALEAFNAVVKKFPQSPRGLYGKAMTLVSMAQQKKSNKLMDTAIDFFKEAGLESFVGSEEVRIAALVELADRAYERSKPELSLKALEKLVEVRQDNVLFSNRLGLGYIADGRVKKAKVHFKKHTEKFPDDYFGRAQLGYILYSEKRYNHALPLLLDGIRNDDRVKNNAKFYRYAGESLTKLNRSDEANILYSEAVSLGLYPSVWQRSLFNEPNLRSKGWWTVEESGYLHDIKRIEKAFSNIVKEVVSIFDRQTNTFSSDGVTQSSQFNLFMNGKKISKNCRKVPKTCALIESFSEAAHCRRGTVKFVSVPASAHIPSFVGQTNTKLQIIMALDTDLEQGVSLRVAKETKTIIKGQLGIVDESFEQEIWNSGSQSAVFLLIDVWHPDLSDSQRRKLGPL